MRNWEASLMRISSEEKADLTFTNEQAREMFQKTLEMKNDKYKFYGYEDNYRMISVFLFYQALKRDITMPRVHLHTTQLTLFLFTKLFSNVDKCVRMTFLIQVLSNKLDKADLFADLVCNAHNHLSGTVIFREQNLMLNCLVQMGCLRVV